MNSATSPSEARWRSTLLSGAIILTLVGLGCVAGELAGGSLKKDRSAAYSDNGPAPFAISKAEHNALLTQKTVHAPPLTAEEAVALLNGGLGKGFLKSWDYSTSLKHAKGNYLGFAR